MAHVLLLSDLHTEFGPFEPRAVDCDVVVLAGDVTTKGRGVPWEDAPAAFGAPVLMVMGNHDHYGTSIDTGLAKAREAAAARGVRILEREEAIVAGTRFLGATLWTDFRLFAGDDLRRVKDDARRVVGDRDGPRHNDFWAIRVAGDGYRRFRPLDAARIHAATVAWLDARMAEPFDGPTVVVTHHAPSILSIPERLRADRFSCAYASPLEWLIEKHQPDAWFHGHVHPKAPDYAIGRTRILSNTRGYLPSDLDPAFDPARVIEVGRSPRPVPDGMARGPAAR
jgi:Icc-related predicted phosphoesterase